MNQREGSLRRGGQRQTGTCQNQTDFAHCNTDNARNATTGTFYHSDTYLAVRAFVRGFTATAIAIFVIWCVWSLAWVLFP
jgi:hypothetical protein